MKKYLKGLFGFAILGLAVLTTSCDNKSDIAPNNGSAEQLSVSNENQILLTGQENMRDLGGLISANGKHIAYHKLFRSGDLASLTPADKNILATEGIKQIIDIRSEAERYSFQDATLDGANNYQMPLVTNFIGGASSQSIFMSRVAQGKEDGYSFMIQFYSNVSDSEVTNWTAMFNLLEIGTPTLWHCTTGKDRTGMTTALVLWSLGVNKATIIDDYMASNKYLNANNQKTVQQYDSQFGQGAGEKLLPVLEARADYINAFFKAIETKYGSVDNFLDQIKVDRNKMRANYLAK